MYIIPLSQDFSKSFRCKAREEDFRRRTLMYGDKIFGTRNAAGEDFRKSYFLRPNFFMRAV
jgi:hypothetical protein